MDCHQTWTKQEHLEEQTESDLHLKMTLTVMIKLLNQAKIAIILLLDLI